MKRKMLFTRCNNFNDKYENDKGTNNNNDKVKE